MSLDAMKQALEALVAAFPIVQHEYFVQGASYGKNFVQTKKDCADLAYVKTKETIFALRERLAQPDQWQGLTDEEVSKLIDNEIGFNSCWGPEEQFARAIEAKLKEKNSD